jgi:hypothetical protein
VQPTDKLLGARPATWQLLYRGSDTNVDIVIKAKPGEQTFDAEGQAMILVGEPVPNGRITFRPSAGEAASFSDPLGEQGEFALAAIPFGRYDVIVDLGTRQIVLPDVDF